MEAGNGKEVSLESLHSSRKLVRTKEAGNLEAVAIKDLDTAEYQRRLSMDFIAKLGAEWDIVKAGAILVSRRANGKLYVIDGQHRAAGALRAGETHILAQVFEGLTLQQEAEYRLAANDRKSEHIFDRFKARLVAEDPVAIGVKAAIEAEGGEIRLGSMSGRDHFVALAAAERLYRYDMKGQHLREVLHILVNAFGSLVSETAPAMALYGISYLLQTHPEADRDRLIEKMNEEGAIGISRRASGHRMIYGGSTWINYYRAVSEVYNYKLGARNRLEWKGGKATLRKHAPEPTEQTDTNNQGSSTAAPLADEPVNEGAADEDANDS